MAGLKGRTIRGATLRRVDGDYANAFAAWQRMGSPQSSNATQYAALEAASVMKAETVQASGLTRAGHSFAVTVPRQGVALLVIDAG